MMGLIHRGEFLALDSLSLIYLRTYNPLFYPYPFTEDVCRGTTTAFFWKHSSLIADGRFCVCKLNLETKRKCNEQSANL